MKKRKIDISAERNYENLKQQTGNLPRVSQSKYYWAVSPKIDEFDLNVFHLIFNKSVLEIGCSNGGKSMEYSKHCAHVTGVDLSDVAIDIAQRNANPKTTFICCDAHKLPFDDHSFDAVIVNGLLHHLNLPVALGEIDRVLKRGGFLFAREPLGINPLIQLYRFLTPKARTIDERPFSKDDMFLINTTFSPIKISYFGFTSLISAFFKMNVIRKLTIYIDNKIESTFMKKQFWQFAGIFKTKKHEKFTGNI